MQEFNLATNLEALADAFPDRPLLCFRDRRFSYGQFRARARRLAHVLRGAGLGRVVPRAELEDWQSGQDHVGLYLYNGNEYLEGMAGSFLSRTVPFNVNYRYVADELTYLFRDAAPRAVVYHARFAPALRAALAGCDDPPRLLLQVADASGEPLLPGAVDYEQALAESSEAPLDAQASPDDLYMLYTGGTTGMPKGVLWRQHDVFMGAMGGVHGKGTPHANVASLVEGARRVGSRLRCMPVPPFMHGAAHWIAFLTIHNGGYLVLQDTPERLVAEEIWSLAERERVTLMLVVGDAFAVPLLDALRRREYRLSDLASFGSGGALLSPHVKDELCARLPQITIRDTLGSSESGSQGVAVPGGAEFEPTRDTVVVSHDLCRQLSPGEDETGWLARRGPIPLGYLNDADKTRRAFVHIDGVRHAVPGDHARLTAEGRIALLGRGSVCINTGGEKVYPEEVEQVLKAHPLVHDVVVVGASHPKWGQEVVAVVQPTPDGVPTLDPLKTFASTRLAGYKLPRRLVLVETLVRSPAGKADYRWAKAQAEAQLTSA